MEYFVEERSVVREIWGKADTILFIFAGAAAEFALNKSVDWLYYTGKLPADPLARLFSTITYARQIVFSEKETANKAIDKITAIHAGVEESRGKKIPEWAYRDVLFMLIYYSIASFEIMERKLSQAEKEEVYNVFYRLGLRMNLSGLPETYIDWLPIREIHLQQDLAKSEFTIDLYKQYKKHLGYIRYKIVLEAQALVIPNIVKNLLAFKNGSILCPFLKIYKTARRLKIEWAIKSILLPRKFHAEVKSLDV